MKHIVIIIVAFYCLASCVSSKLTQTDIAFAREVSSWDTVDMVPKVQKIIAKHKTDTMILLDYCSNSCFCNPTQYLAFIKNDEVELFKTIWEKKKKVIRINEPEISRALLEFLSEYHPICNEKEVDYTDIRYHMNGSSSMSLNLVILDKKTTFYPFASTCINRDQNTVKKWAENVEKLIN